MDDPVIRSAGPAERDDVVRVLAAAFADYPMMRWVLGGRPDDDPDGLRALVGFFTDVRYAMGWPVLLRLAGGRPVAAALVNLPGAEPFLERFEEGLERLRHAIGPAAWDRLERFEAASEGHEPDAPHFFVGMVGVLPDHRRRGHGRALLEHVHGMADRGGYGVALSTESPANVPFYRALGYRVVGEKDVGDLHTWGFWREPRAEEPPGPT